MSLQSEFPSIVDLLKEVRAMRALQIDYYNAPNKAMIREMVQKEDNVDNALRKLKQDEII